jgi:hypothetical protein
MITKCINEPFEIIDALNWSLQHNPQISHKSYLNAVIMQKPNALKWLIDHFPNLYHPNIMEIALYYGNLSLIVILFDFKPEQNIDNAIKKSIQFGHLRVLNWIWESIPYVRDNIKGTNILIQGVFYGRINIISWIYENIAINQGDSFNPDVILIPIQKGYLHVVQWFYKNTPLVNVPVAILEAIAHAQNDIFEWLFVQNQIKCEENIIKIITKAVSFNRIDIILYIAENVSFQALIMLIRYTFCVKNKKLYNVLRTIRSLDFYQLKIKIMAKDGNLDEIKKIFKEKSHQDFTKWATDSALLSGQTHVLQWLKSINHDDYCNHNKDTECLTYKRQRMF